MLRRDLRCVIPPLVMNQPWRQPPEKGFHVLNTVRPQSCSNYDPKVGGSIVISNPNLSRIFRSRPTNLTINAPHHLESASQSAPKMTALTCGVWPAVSTRPRITKLYQIQVTPSFCWDLVMCVWIPFQQTCDALFDCFLGMIHWTHWKLLEGLQKIRRAWSGPHWKMDIIQMLKVHRFEMCYMLYLLGPPPFRMVIVLNDNTSFHKWQFETFKNSDWAFGVRLHKYVYLEKMCI